MDSFTALSLMSSTFQIAEAILTGGFRNITSPWVALKPKGEASCLLAIYDCSLDGKLSNLPVRELGASGNPGQALQDLSARREACRVYFIATSPGVSFHFDFQTETFIHCDEDSITTTKGFDSIAAQWSQTRRQACHALDAFAKGSDVSSSQGLTETIMRVTPSIVCYRQENHGLSVVIRLQASRSEIAVNHESWLENIFNRYVHVWLEEGVQLCPCHSSECPQELRLQLYLLQFYRTAMRLYEDFSVHVGAYDQTRSHGQGPQHSAIQPSVLADVVADAYHYNTFVDTATATATTAKSLVGVIRATSVGQEMTTDIQCLLAETEAYSDGLASPFTQLTNRLGHHIALSSMSRNISDSFFNRLLSVLASIFLPLSLATSLLSMSTRFIDLGPLLYDFCGVVLLFASLVILVLLLLQKGYQWLHWIAKTTEFRETVGSHLARSFLSAPHNKSALWVCLSVAWLMIMSSFLVGMIIDINLGFRILGYGIAGLVVFISLVVLSLAIRQVIG